MLGIILLVCLVLNEEIALGLAEAPLEKSGTGKEILPKNNAIIAGRAKKWKLKLMLKALFLIKRVLLVMSLPFSVVTAKILSWNAFVLSFLALITSKLLLLRTLFSGPIKPTPTPGIPAIIIQSASNAKRPFRAGPKIYIQPDLSEEDMQTRKRWREVNK